MAEWAGPDGTRWLWEAPPARDVVHLIGHLLPALDQGQGWRELAAWLAERCLNVEGLWLDGHEVAWSALSRGERVRVCELLGVEVLDAWAAHVLTQIALPTELLTQVRTMARVAASGGCECRRCKTGDARGPLKACLYADVTQEAERRVSVWWPLRETDLSGAPWWMWQMAEAWQMGRSEAIVEARKKAERKQDWDEMLKKKGRS